MNKAILSIVIAMFLAGCAVGPDYKRPTIDTPKAWRVDEKEAKDTANTTWWNQFDDPVMDELIDEALKQNYDLRIATSRVDEFVGRYWVGRSGLFPQIGANAFAGQNRVSEQTVSTTALVGPEKPVRQLPGSASTAAGRSTSGENSGGPPRRRKPIFSRPRRHGRP